MEIPVTFPIHYDNAKIIIASRLRPVIIYLFLHLIQEELNMKANTMILLVVFLISSVALMAHPAKAVNLNFDKATSTLRVSFEHPVENPAKHFIHEFEVQINGKLVVTQLDSKQENKDGGSVMYKLIDVKAGDKISVVVDCNKGGKKTATITVK